MIQSNLPPTLSFYGKERKHLLQPKARQKRAQLINDGGGAFAKGNTHHQLANYIQHATQPAIAASNTHRPVKKEEAGARPTPVVSA